MRRLPVVVLGVLVAAGLTRAVAGARERAGPPALVVVIVIDQFPAAFPERFGSLFGGGGFRHLIRRGALYPNLMHEHALTLTAPGHATLFTGAPPRRHGVVSNSWYDHDRRRLRSSVADPRFPVVGAPAVEAAEGASPRALLVPGLGDALRLSFGPAAQVVSLSLKDRAAILSGGWAATSVYWLDPATCRFVTSAYYRDELEPWVEAFNRTRPCDRYAGRMWELLLPAARYGPAGAGDGDPEETNAFGLGTVFPHPVSLWDDPLQPLGRRDYGRYLAVMVSPFGNTILMALARRAVTALALGADDAPDLLVVSLSSNDLVGHAFGPDSLEVADTTARLDRLLEDFRMFLDRTVGRGRWLMAVTSDHGVAPIPERAQRLGLLPSNGGSYRFDPVEDRERVERALRKRFFGDRAVPPGFPGFIRVWDGKSEPFVLLDTRAPRQVPGGVSRSEVRRAAAREIRRLDSVAEVFHAGQRDLLAASGDPVARAVYRSWHRERGGDLYVLRRPYWLPVSARSTTHGTPYAYDARVPLILYGRGVRHGLFPQPVSATDLAPTLAFLIGADPPAGSEGRVLAEATDRGAGGTEGGPGVAGRRAGGR